MMPSTPQLLNAQLMCQSEAAIEDGYDLSELADPVLGNCDHQAIGALLNNEPLSLHDDKLANLEVGGTMEMENFEASMFELSDSPSVHN